MIPQLIGKYICEKCEKSVPAIDSDIYSVMPKCECGGKMFFQPLKHTGPINPDGALEKKY